MNKFNDLSSAVTWLEHQQKFQKKKDLNLLINAFSSLNINFDNVKKIHVGGTNGKGSTSAFITNVLVNNNYQVGTFTSPYLVKFNERIKLNNQDINDQELLKLINFIYNFNEDLIGNFGYSLSFFELLTLIAFKYFSDQKVDVIIMEIGIGGILDATNIIEYDVLVITSIGIDHVNVLGNTLEAIAANKLGALKGETHLIANPSKSLKKQFIAAAKTYTFIKEIKPFNLKLLGDYQQSNANLAYLTIKHLFNLNDDEIIPYLENTTWPARLEKVSDNLYLDGAHNISAMLVLRNSLLKLFPNQRINIVFSALKDKDIAGMLKAFTNKQFKVFLTSFPDFRFEGLETFATKKRPYIENPFDLIKELKKLEEIVVVCGSLHFVGYLKANLNKI